ncbi:MAG: sodium:proton antiporter [Clostridia bacterium]|nr:sodium:proton antiporter [Clostridia bacterium]
MSFAANFPLFCIVFCLICSVVSSLLNGKVARIITLLLSIVVMIMSIFVMLMVHLNGEPITYIMGHFPHPWGNEIRMGLLEPFFASIFSLILFLSLLGGERHLSSDLDVKKSQFYYVMTDLILSSFLVLLYTNDIFTGYVFIEICTLTSCGLLMIRQVGRTTLASIRYMIFSLIGSGLFLMGVIVLYGITGHLLFPNLHEAIAKLNVSGEYKIPLLTSISLITVGLSIKSGLFPFHFWMPDTYGYATPSSSGILSGLVSKVYILYLLKIIFNVFGTNVFYNSGIQHILFWFGVCAMIIGSIDALKENNINRMLANSSAAQIGYIYMSIGISPTLGVVAAIYHIVTHAFTKPLLFITSSRLCDAANGSKIFHDLQGKARKYPLTGALFTIGAFSMIGIPLTMGFISKYIIATSAINTEGMIVIPLIALALSTILNTIYFGRTLIRIYTPSDSETCMIKPKVSYLVSTIVLALINILTGIFSTPLISIIQQRLEFFGKVG